MLALIAITSGAFSALTASSAAAAALPAPAANTDIQSRCAHLAVSSHVVSVGQTITFTAGPKRDDACHGSVGWTWGVTSGAELKSGCRINGTHCELKATSATDGYADMCLTGSSGFGQWNSCTFYIVIGKGKAVIEGYVRDRDHNGVIGTKVKAEGPQTVSASTGEDGYYAMTVEPGHYEVTPSGGPSTKSEASYAPTRRSVSMPTDGRSEADFVLKAGLQVQLKFSANTVPATGFAVVSGTITTSEYGKPLPNETVHLNVMPGSREVDSVTAAPLAALCGPGDNRIWPAGALNAPDPTPIDVTTGANGQYEFTVAVGSSPGAWKLQATALVTNAEGKSEISSDPDASDTQTINVTPVGSLALANFTNEVNLLARSTSAFANVQNNYDSLIATLISASVESAGGGSLAGLAYAEITGTDGTSVLVFPADQPPFSQDGVISATDTANQNDLVLDPSQWVGGTGGSVTIGSLANALQHGVLQQPPTLAQWTSGADVQAWKTTAGNVARVQDGGFEYQGWAYPPASAVTGDCT